MFRLNSSPEKRRIVGEGVWVGGGQLVSLIGTVAGVRLLTEQVPPDVFGKVSLFIGLSALASSVFGTPFLQAALRFYPGEAARANTAALRRAVSRLLFTSTAALVFVLLIGGAVYSYAVDVSFLIFVCLAALLVVDIKRSLELSFLTAARRQSSFAFWSASDTCIRPLAASAMVAVCGVTPQAVLGGYLCGALFVSTLFLFNIQRDGLVPRSTVVTRDEILTQRIRDYSKPLIPSASVSWLSSVSGRYVVATLVGLAQAGLYSAAYGLVSRPFLISGGILANTLRPVYFEAVSTGDKQKEYRLIKTWIVAAVVIFATGIIGTFLFGDLLVSVLLAKEYAAAASLFPAIAIGCSFLYLSQIYNTISLAYERSSAVFLSECTAAIGSVVIGVPMTWRFGVAGAAAAVPCYLFLQLLSAWWLSRRHRNTESDQR